MAPNLSGIVFFTVTLVISALFSTPVIVGLLMIMIRQNLFKNLLLPELDRESLNPKDVKIFRYAFHIILDMSPLNNEPHRKLKCLYAGFTSIDTKLGMKTMNHAIETVLKNTNTHQWLPVNITISPSTVNLSYHNYTAVNLRICSIPFFGIYNKDEKICGIVQHTADDLFICHVITCHTNAMELCKTLKAACELRYQQCVDSKMFDNIKSNIDSINHVKVDQSNKQTKNKQIILINIINHIEQMKYEICKRIRQHSNWIKSCLLYSNDERLLETTKTDDTNDNDNNHNNNEQATANLYYSA